MAKESHGHFDSTADDKRALTAASWAKFVAMFLGTGIRNGGSNLQVTSPHTGMKVRVSAGIANINGYGYWLAKEYAEDTEYLELDVPEAHPSKPRIDRVVLRLDLRISERRIYTTIKLGEASNSPEAPVLERNANIYELSLGKYKVAAGALSISPESITDERLDPQVCGIIDSLISADTEGMYKDFQDAFTALMDRFGKDFEGLESTFYDMLVLKEQAFESVFKQMKDKIAAVETDITALQSFDPDNYFELPGTITTETFTDKGKEEMAVKNANGDKVFSRVTTFTGTGKNVLIVLYEVDGVTIRKKRQIISEFTSAGKVTTVEELI